MGGDQFTATTTWGDAAWGRTGESDAAYANLIDPFTGTPTRARVDATGVASAVSGNTDAAAADVAENALLEQQQLGAIERLAAQEKEARQAVQEKDKALQRSQQSNQQLLAQLQNAQAALEQSQAEVNAKTASQILGGVAGADAAGGLLASEGGGHRHHRKHGAAASAAAEDTALAAGDGGAGGAILKSAFLGTGTAGAGVQIGTPHSIKGAGKLTKAELAVSRAELKELAKDMPDLKRISLHPKCEAAPVRLDDNNRTSGTGGGQCHVKDLHPTSNCQDCELSYETGGQTLCAGYAWVNTNHGPGPKYMHMASIVALVDGTLIVAWQQAIEREGDSDQHIALASSLDGGRTWEQHRRLFQEDEEANSAGGAGPQWGPAMIRSDKGTVNMFYSQGQNCKVLLRENGWTPGGNVLMTTSVHGSEWTMPVVLAEQGGGFPLVTANPPVVMRAGTGGTNWALPVWRESPRKSNCNATEMATEMPAGLSAGVLRGDMACHQEIHRLRVLCRTCKMLVGRAFEQCVARKCPNVLEGEKKCGSRSWLEQMALSSNNTWLIEGTVVRYGNKDLVQFFRTAVGKVYRAESHDGGINWTKAEPVDLPNPNSKLNAVVLSDGQTVIAYNSHNRTNGLKLMRVNLTVAISPDRGKTWTKLADLEIVAGSHVWHVSAPVQRYAGPNTPTPFNPLDPKPHTLNP